MDVREAGFLLVDCHQDVFLHDFPVGLARHGIDGDLAEISGGDEIVEGLRGFLLVEGVLRDDGTERREVGAEYGFAGLDDRLVIDGDGDGHQDHDDADDDH